MPERPSGPKARPRLAACDPCRSTKNACDHTRPVCMRCLDRGQGDSCVYRADPFKKNKKHRKEARNSAPVEEEPRPQSQSVETSTQGEGPGAPTTHHQYPNPGFLGSSSHSAIYSQMSMYIPGGSIRPDDTPATQADTNPSPFSIACSAQSAESSEDPHLIGRAAYALERLETANIRLLEALVRTWLNTGANLPLATPFVAPAAATILEWTNRPLTSPSTNDDNLAQRSAFLIENTSKPIIITSDLTFDGFASQMLGTNLRWETIGIFYENLILNSRVRGDQKIINYIADTHCSAMFATFKEDLLELFRNRHGEGQEERVSALRSDLERKWQELPAHFRLKATLKDCHGNPFQLDFLASTRLDYLHTCFLLDLVSLQQTSEPNQSILTVATQMLALVVETIVLRNGLINSGTSLNWKVSCLVHITQDDGD
ncbi:hypothetical protein MRS44_015997 [Fusarium solani]|uniref:uncharacterized protein n=1 Tax=Fusarium solani TaxID=169388 RepID=UPI0032C451B3|nr:hypothetical protein MRS44_015997 [Fusarium solani]